MVAWVNSMGRGDLELGDWEIRDWGVLRMAVDWAGKGKGALAFAGKRDRGQPGLAD
jgi:hypothetical protein